MSFDKQLAACKTLASSVNPAAMPRNRLARRERCKGAPPSNSLGTRLDVVFWQAHRKAPSSRGSPAPNTASPRALGAAGAALLACAMASLFTEGDWGTCATLLAAGGVGALVSCACAMADDEPTAEDAAAAWGAQQDTRQAATVTWDGDKHPPAPTHRASARSSHWGEEATAPAKTAPAGAPEATATVTPAAAVPAPAAAKTSFWAASAATPDAAATEKTSFWAASEASAEELAEPVTFEQATGAARLEAARRCRAAEVTESERQFMREFTAMMAAGLVVVLRVDGSDGVAVTLSLQEFRNEPILEWHFTENGERGRLSLSDIQTVRGQSLNDELARRSFVIEGRDRVLVFHSETPDICALVVDGLAMLVADHKRRAARRRSSLGPARKAIAARRSSPKKPLAAKN